MKEGQEIFVDEVGDVLVALLLAFGTERAELLDDLGVFEMQANDFVVEAAALDGIPVHDSGAVRGRITEVGLAVNVF